MSLRRKLAIVVSIVAIVVGIVVIVNIAKRSKENTFSETADNIENNEENLGNRASASDTVVKEKATSTDVSEDNISTVDIDWKEYANNQPEELNSFLEGNGYDYEDLAEGGCQQLITVSVNGTNANINLYTVGDDGNWQDMELLVDGYVGANGANKEVSEGSKKTPMGLFSIGEGFYIEDEPETGLNTFRITEDTYWIDDPESDYYNQRVESADTSKWNSAEHMIGYYEAYKYGFVMNYNMDPIVSGKGSAFFVHVGNAPTAGCVAMPKEYILKYMKILDSIKKPYILIGN